MMTQHPLTAIICLAAGCMLLLATAFADTTPAREITWEELAPELPVDDPFSDLDDDQLYDLALIAQVRELQTQAGTTANRWIEDAEAAQLRLTDQGVDVDGMLSQEDQYLALQQSQAYETRSDLNGQSVKIPGYVVPLEFDGDKVSEFLLVPYVGACIHVPPPPPNQIVLVEPDESFASEGLFEPVWVTGVLSTQTSNPELNLQDGSAPVDVGYNLKAVTIEPYSE